MTHSKPCNTDASMGGSVVAQLTVVRPSAISWRRIGGLTYKTTLCTAQYVPFEMMNKAPEFKGQSNYLHRPAVVQASILSDFVRRHLASVYPRLCVVVHRANDTGPTTPTVSLHGIISYETPNMGLHHVRHLHLSGWRAYTI